MPELEPQPDPIASLHRMSTTAGAAAQDYVAINNLAVASALLGFATALAFLAPPFLVIGLAALACGALALRQIRNSNGTQTGRALAFSGILLALLVAGGVAAVALSRQLAQRADKSAINATLHQYGQHVIAGDYPAAYALLDPLFQTRVPLHRFEQALRIQQDPNIGAGRLTSFRGNDFFEFAVNEGFPTAATKAVFRYEKSPGDGRAIVLLRKDPSTGRWRIVRLELLDALVEPPRRQN